ncbi:NAD(P)/FAD-dependent oxidoreductase [Parvularcula marina]|uniref:NAD(P)/FAD-dependent oxidoreductase n=1 Tax=Parvularcula marina TaxID=2292771 RepID=A0A371REG7_9PROT|nr:NAD(P)/FAD-dependent oxidoreductase [Parvularcula marina]RFB03820.1 NAD(P)/FAD-dependent oxidoreductase [Parvularcula marina]
MNSKFDIVVIGAGAAGLFCAGLAGQMGQRVLVIDHAKKPAEKVRISGGGRCNFTNIHTSPDRFISANPHFAKSALARYTPNDFCELMARHHLTWNEKTLGQLFCDQKSGAVIRLLLDELETGQGELWLETKVENIDPSGDGFSVKTTRGTVEVNKVVIATGGLSIPKMGATGFAYHVARQFGHEVVPRRAGLVPFTFEGEALERFASISGTALPVRAATGGRTFEEAMLFTHRGLSGPAILQVSSYWEEGAPVTLDLLTGAGGEDALLALKRAHPKKTLGGAMDGLLPGRLLRLLTETGHIPQTGPLAEVSDRDISTVAAGLGAFEVTPSGTEGYRTAEVTLGGVDTDGLSSKTMESKHQSGLYFIGECVDVTGWLGGYNFQWAWASAHAAAMAVVG